MLNATNRTLSANLNRLNLGTRNLANLAGLNTGMSFVLRSHDAGHHVDVSRAEDHRIAIRPSIKPVPPKPVEVEPVPVDVRKRQSYLGSSRSSYSSATSSQERFAGLGFSAFDLSDAAFAARAEMRMWSAFMPRQQATWQTQAQRWQQTGQAAACHTRATRVARAVDADAAGRSVRLEFLEPSTSS